MKYNAIHEKLIEKQWTENGRNRCSLTTMSINDWWIDPILILLKIQEISPKLQDYYKSTNCHYKAWSYTLRSWHQFILVQQIRKVRPLWLCVQTRLKWLAFVFLFPAWYTMQGDIGTGDVQSSMSVCSDFRLCYKLLRPRFLPFKLPRLPYSFAHTYLLSQQWCTYYFFPESHTLLLQIHGFNF